MRVKNLSAAVATAACLSLSATGMATGGTVTFELGSGGSVPSDPLAPSPAEFDALPSSFSQTSGDLSLTVRAQSYGAISAAGVADGVEVFFVFGQEDEKIGRFADGAGIFNSLSDDRALKSSALTSFEYLLLTFNQAVTLTDLAFGAFSGGDDFFTLIEDRSGDDAFGAGDVIGFDIPVGDSVPTGATGAFTTWAVLAPGGGSSFVVDSVTVAPVPLPATGWLIVAGLGALAASRRHASSARQKR